MTLNNTTVGFVVLIVEAFDELGDLGDGVVSDDEVEGHYNQGRLRILSERFLFIAL